MNRILFSSFQPGVGKTSVALGLAQARSNRSGYLKPFGDRPYYRKKRLWDGDVLVAARQLNLGDDPSAISVGFNHGKIRFMHDQEGLSEKLESMALGMEQMRRDLIFIEAGGHLFSGASIDLDPFSLASTLKAKLYVILAGENNELGDQAVFLASLLKHFTGVFGGIIVNKSKDAEEFEMTALPAIRQSGLPLAGVIPFHKELGELTVSAIADQIPAQVITGGGLPDRRVGRIFLGAVSPAAARKAPTFHGQNRLVITTADHEDLIVASLDKDTAAIILSGEPLPHASILARAEEMRIPILVVHDDLLSLASRIHKLEPRLTLDDQERLSMLVPLMKEHLDIPGLDSVQP